MITKTRPLCPRRATGLMPLALLTILAAQAPGQQAMKGEWAPKFDWPNVGIHVHMLPTGTVLFWSRREKGETLDPHNCTPRQWDPATNTFSNVPQPGFNLFCAGHTFLADGRLLVVGGHISDSHGERHATVYDPWKNNWTRIDDMNRGRWYPTAVTLPDGRVLVSSGSDESAVTNDVQQIGKDGHWTSIVNFDGLPLYPRLHVAPDGRVFMAGARTDTYLLDTSGGGDWKRVADRTDCLRDYAPSVMYDVGKVLFVGGGIPPLKTAETINLNEKVLKWRPTGSMSIGRRHHNATLLPDGTVLVTGGTSGDGGPNNGFNDLSKPVLAAELWDPASGKWTVLASESVPRCYHSAAILLPDARVLSTGGGEYRPDNQHENDPKDSHKDAQIFSPPYLFRGSRPVITAAPDQVTYGQTFEVQTPAPNQVRRVSWVRLSSVTHAFNTNQRINFLKSTAAGGKLMVTAPAGANVCPPGHYMLFLLSVKGVPSVAKTIRIQ
jgi:hypothetical protein